MSDVRITNFDDLVAVSKGDVVQLPPFSEGKPFVARLKRPSMLAMVKTGKIPNELLVEANKLFTKGPSRTAVENVANSSMMVDMCNIMDEICKESFVEPTWDEISRAGVEITDEQKMFVFSYVQSGVRALKSFRDERGSSSNSGGAQTIGAGNSSIGDDGDK